MLRHSRRGNSQEVVFINLVPTFPGVWCSIWFLTGPGIDYTSNTRLYSAVVGAAAGSVFDIR
jgi:hypothetical protein